jgi:hypothetical protein
VAGSEFRRAETTNLVSKGNSVLVTAMFCKWCEMAGFEGVPEDIVSRL